ncbi:MAG TPA: F0F1 ATP synthase subunit B [Pseudonocardiaceae bacterium]|jgi:ATP synthase F0 subunit b|nr:F0F1 ATP synthase subunit B [Pseudonocardiaceae bacterium]
MSAWIGELVGFVIILFALWRYVVPPVRRTVQKQQELIGQQLKASEEAAAQLAEAERRYSDALTEARVEAAKIRDGARADAERIVVEMREQAQREVARIKQRGEDDLTQQRQQVIRELRARIGELSVDLTGRLVNEHLSAQENRAATVDLLLGELEQMAGSTAVSKGEA